MITVYDEIEQGSEAWYALRLGIPTASHFSDCVAVQRDPEKPGVRDKYMRKLAGERITGLRREEFKNAAMERGNAMEPSLRATYELISGNKTRQIGFVTHARPYGIIGASPDSLVGDDGIVEFKSMEPAGLIEVLEKDRIPPEHVPQCQGGMLVTGRIWCDLAIGYEGMPMFRRRIARDNDYLNRLEVGLDVFIKALAARVERIKAYGQRRG